MMGINTSVAVVKGDTRVTAMEKDTSVTVVDRDISVTVMKSDTSVRVMECNTNGTGTGRGTHKLYWHATHLQSKLPKQYLKDL